MEIGSLEEHAKGSLAKNDEACSIYQSCNRRSSMGVAGMEACGRCLDLTMESVFPRDGSGECSWIAGEDNKRK